MPRGVYERGPSHARARRVRTWQPGDPIPEGEPGRYPDRDGYVRLRWRVGPAEYVEAREHRFVVAAPPDKHVHHHNRSRADNRPVNLEPLSALDHLRLHGLANRRFDRARARALYESGLSTIAVGRILGVDPSNIWRGLNREGFVMRQRPRRSEPERAD